MNKTRKILLDMLAELEALRAAARENRKPVALDQQAVGRLSRMDSLQVQAMDKAQEASRQKQRLKIQAALARLEAGAYGFCVTCDEKISKKRLALDPAIPLCIECARGR